MKHFDVTLPRPKSEYAQVFCICCLHIGHRGYDRDKAEQYRSYILKTPDTYAISLGDDIDNAIPGDEKHNSMIFDNSCSPEEQYVKACEFWRPLAWAGKLLWTADSNHWWRSEAKTGISIAKHMNEYLRQNAKKIKPEWGRWTSLAKVKVGRNEYVIHSWHGTGGGTTPEGGLRKCRATAGHIDADVYLMGHVHKKIVYEDMYVSWRGGCSPEERKRAYGVTGSFLRWNDSYAERGGLPPAVRGAIKLELGGKRWDVKISL